MVRNAMKKLAAHGIFCLVLIGATQGRSETRLDVTYRQADGLRLALDAFVPDAAGPTPAVIYVHGGGFVTGDKRPYPPWLALVAGEGFAWFSINYRLSPKYLVSHQ